MDKSKICKMILFDDENEEVEIKTFILSLGELQ
jgi:hypothetical protein